MIFGKNKIYDELFIKFWFYLSEGKHKGSIVYVGDYDTTKTDFAEERYYMEKVITHEKFDSKCVSFSNYFFPFIFSKMTFLENSLMHQFGVFRSIILTFHVYS